MSATFWLNAEALADSQRVRALREDSAPRLHEEDNLDLLGQSTRTLGIPACAQCTASGSLS